jgi:hypothetical protein
MATHLLSNSGGAIRFISSSSEAIMKQLITFIINVFVLLAYAILGAFAFTALAELYAPAILVYWWAPIVGGVAVCIVGDMVLTYTSVLLYALKGALA